MPTEAGCHVEQNLATDDIADKLAKRAFAWTGYRCYLCGCGVQADNAWHLDHYHPLALGGADGYDNLEMACVGCNLFKADLPIHLFLARKGWIGIQPLFPTLRLSERPVDELWRMNPALARRFARRPREVPATKRWPAQTLAVERALVRALVRGRSDNDLWLARSVRDPKDEPDMPAGGALYDNYWRALMGLLPTFGDKRRRPSEWIMPTRTGGADSVPADPAFRLRFRVSPAQARAFAEGAVAEPTPDIGSPDQDEVSQTG